MRTAVAAASPAPALLAASPPMPALPPSSEAREDAGRLRCVCVGNLALNVLVAGHGPDVLLVHGFPDSHDVWRHQVPVLVRAGYRVIAPDLRGCGDSEAPLSVAEYELPRVVADLIALLDRMGVARARVVGHDVGAVIAWHLAMLHPERVERLVALSVGHPEAYRSADPMQSLRRWYVWFLQLPGVPEMLLSAWNFDGLRRLAHHDDELARWRELLSRPGRLTAAINYYRANLALVRSRTRFAPVSVPVHGIWSSGDRFLTEKQMLASRRYVNGRWRYTRLNGTDHWMQLDDPERFGRVLLDALASGDAAR